MDYKKLYKNGVVGSILLRNFKWNRVSNILLCSPPTNPLAGIG
jgi:hypothetical protein